MIPQTVIQVGMAELNVIQGEGMLKTSGLGSCIGLVLYDLQCKAAGMAHMMLPSSSIARAKQMNEAKFIDTAIPALIHSLVELGASRKRLSAKMAGGSQMFALTASTETMRIGSRNISACRELLTVYGIQLVAEDTGGHYGRTIEFNCATGKLFVRSVNQGSKEI